ncbi:MAG: hypothetical protein JWP05_2243 [Microbacteriaceae bacterium]|nr:hypothetical protein [Microbacteriaceae bacterium]
MAQTTNLRNRISGFEPIVMGDRDIRANLTTDGTRLALAVWHRGEPVLSDAGLGMTIDGDILGGNCVLRGHTVTDIVENFEMKTGKAVGTHRASHREHRLEFHDLATEIDWALVLRIAADGLAFRYELPAGDRPVLVGQELTDFPFSDSHRTWLLDYQTWYETPRFGSGIRELPPGDYGLPILVTGSGDSHLLISESAIDGRFSGAHAAFTRGAAGGRFGLRTADDELDIPAGTLLPWRVLIIGTLDTVVRSSLVDELAPPTQASDTSWIRPGRAAWSWWSSQYSGAYLEHQKRFADYAADRGWEHVLVDCGWDETWMPDLVAHASRRGVQVHVWGAWSDLDGPEALRKLELWRSWGVAGIKVDFMESEARERYRWYDAIIAESARVGLMVNFHGSVIPRGWARTHPHIMSYEGIRGAEYYVFYGTPLTAAHNVIQPFTRNVVGSMDYTPVTFSAPERETSDAHELALGIVFESGITHFADEIAEYEARPLVNAFLAEVAPVWNETRLVGGTPDSHVVIARRYGDRWWVGCIATGEARAVDLDLSFLGDGDYVAWSIFDAAESGLADRTELVRSGGRLAWDLPRNGGFVVLFAPAGSELRRASARELRAAPSVTPSVQTLSASRITKLETSAGAELRLPPGWAATEGTTGESGTTWDLVAPASFDAGHVAVVSVESRMAGDPVPVVSHARVFATLAPGAIAISSLPFLACSNAIGPVERNSSNGGGDPRDGRPMLVASVPYADGLGVSAPSSVSYYLAGAAARFTGSVGVDDETPSGVATASIVGDEVVLATFTLRGGDRAQGFDLDVTAVTILQLVITPVSADETHIDWAEARLQVTGD